MKSGKSSLLFFLLLCSFASLFAQNRKPGVSGQVTDASGDPLPFASIYVKGTSRGTTANINGEYQLPLDPGRYELVFQYIGYQQRVEPVTVGEGTATLDVALREEAVELNEVVVRADAEDPAYAVIRKAIARRKYYRDLIESYRCDVYIKGNIKFLDAPQKFMGREIGDMMGSLDSNRQGIIYLSESQSRLSFRQPDLFKEEVAFTKVSGNDNGFGFNSASATNFDLYENYAFFNRQIISPIASNALGYYDYRLVGTFFDQEGRLINKIELLPKRSEDPVYRGFIYIVENLWLIHSADLLLLSGTIKQPGLDSLWLQQVHVPVKGPDTWRIFSQTIRFRAGLFGFRIGGNFTGIYSNYELNPTFPDKFFDNEVYRVEEGANDQSLAYWDSIRPIPLTTEEEVDYVRKDSLQELRRSKPYLDSVDAKNNRFRPLSLFFGYTHNNSYRRRYFSIGSPLTTVQFNTVQGFNADLAVTYRREYDELGLRWLEFRPTFNYGFAEQKLRGTLSFTYHFNQVKRPRLSVEGGVETAQFNSGEPVTKTLNSLYSLLVRRNYMKLYDRSFGRVTFQQELVNGVFLRTYADYSRRSPLLNRTNYSFGDSDKRAYSSNDPLDPDQFGPSFVTGEALEAGISLRLRYRQKFVTYPDRKFVEGSALPDLWIDYRKGLPAFGSKVNFDHLALRLAENYGALGVLGYFEFVAEWGTFLRRDSLQFIDYKHFNGNRTLLGNPNNYLNGFFRLPYYDFSTTGSYLQVHFQHHFDGFLLDRIPGLRKLGWDNVLGANFLYTASHGSYLELNFGFDNIGFGPLRLFRVDGVAARHFGNKDWDFGLVIGIRLP